MSVGCNNKMDHNLPIIGRFLFTLFVVVMIGNKKPNPLLGFDLRILCVIERHSKENKMLVDPMQSMILFLFASGVPAVVDFAAMRDAIKRLGGDPGRINPLCPVDLVIDHSVQVDVSRRYKWSLRSPLI